MGIHVIKMPDIGEGIAEVELVAWNVKVGDMIVEDQVMADVMTDKATIEIPSPVHGKVLALGGAAGQVMAVGSELIRIEVEGAGNVDANAATPVAAAPTTPAPAAAKPAPAVVEKPAPAASTPTPATIPASTAPVAAKSSSSLPSAARANGEKPIASPAVRRRAWDLGIELQFVPGTGTAGRITHEDLEAYLARGPVSAGSGGSTYRELHEETAIPVIGLRRKIAQKMQDAKRRIPHFSYVEEVDVTELEALRTQLNQKWGKERGKLSLLPLLMRAVVLAVRDYPQINARYDDEAGVVTQFAAVHLGIAAQTPAGLMVPVVRHAEARDLWSNANEMGRLAEAARTGKATREELSGSTITISSLGALGGIVSTPVINSPEVAIIGVNKMVERPMIRNGQVVARKMMNLSSSFDHRVVDGMDAAQFIQTIRGYLECPATLFIE
ncbi:dihydrolipoamide acetyltransferase family protein [Undibacterium macrobrachii]|uniref:Dihydrolipoamide acetyltransferase component of pyruvate dehydrogenase complex n=1 Tax=Undibacterium macrobrachii TaxID=1119058 RepID=A0ABQ2XGL2_9BURK|nr:dihydrolipoamide acetyltransferase family protein [Undibacterium macrobrachii]GGX15853.1 lipoamide acyltransferase component of branched-chain alpha-keto acid dehydrogenase complex [Undibacterium macrobrachii]